MSFSYQPENNHGVDKLRLGELRKKLANNPGIIKTPEVTFVTGAFIEKDGQPTNNPCVVIGVYPNHHQTFVVPSTWKEHFEPFPIVLVASEPGSLC